MEIKRVDVLQNPRWRREVDWVAQGQMDRAVLLTIGSQPVAAIVGVGEAELAIDLCRRWHEGGEPFTPAKMAAWREKLLRSLQPHELGIDIEGEAGQ